MAWIWFTVCLVLWIIIIRKNTKIFKLKKELEELKKLKEYSTTAEETFDLEPINYEPDYKVSWERAKELQARTIESQYLYPIKDLEDTSHFFYGKKVVISGVYDNYPDRNDLARLFWEVGADIDTTVGKYTEFLIIGDDAGPKKLETAKQRGITIIKQYQLKKYFPS